MTPSAGEKMSAPAGEMTIGFCAPDEIARVMAFLHDHWSATHILANDRALMDWQHGNARDARYDILLAREADGAIAAMLGVIDTRRYGDAPDDASLWLTTWMVRPGLKAGGLGLRLVKHLQRTVPHALIGTVGNNAATEPLYRALGFATGTLDRYGIVNPARAEPLVEGAAHYRPPAHDSGATVRILTDAWLDTPEAARLFACPRVPVRSAAYIRTRYLAHPVYRYALLGIEAGGGIAALAVARICEAKDATALRIVDVIGPDAALAPMGDALARHIAVQGHAFADLYIAGAPDTALAASAWAPVPQDGPLRLPNHFEPFTPGNVTLRYAAKTRSPAPLRLVKADCDQDRPNIALPATSAQPAAHPDPASATTGGCRALTEKAIGQ